MSVNDLLGILGYAALTAALFVNAALCLLSVYALLRSGKLDVRYLRMLVHLQSGLMAGAVLALGALLERSVFEYQLVFDTVENAMPWYYRIAGIWSGQAGSLLFWSFLMSLAVSLAVELSQHLYSGRLTHSIVLILECTLFFFLLPDVMVSNPFEKTWLLTDGAIAPAFFPPQGAKLLVAVDGQGMNPSLRHPAMLTHPPALYLGLIGLFIPYAFALAALAHHLQPLEWIKRLYRLSLAAWVFLTIGMLLGSWWAYTILGWDGYWGWDAVEISGLLPWLLSTALLHSMFMAARGRSFQRWSVVLALLCAILILFGILITRSGILESVHAYASSTMGPVLTVLVCAHLAAAAFFLVKRWSDLGEQKAQLRRDLGATLVTLSTILLVGISLFYLFGQTFPLTSALFSAQNPVFTPELYENISSPLWLGFAVLMGLHPFASIFNRSKRAFTRALLLLGVTALVVVALLARVLVLDVLSVFSFWVTVLMLAAWIWELYSRFFKPLLARRARLASLGSICIHLGFAVLAFGILGVERLSSHADVRVNPGVSVVVDDFSLEALPRGNLVRPDGQVEFSFPLSLTSPNGALIPLTPLIEHFPKLEAFHAQPAIHSTWVRDIQLVAESLPAAAADAFALRVNIYPLMVWLWAGGVLIVAGGIITTMARRSA